MKALEHPAMAIQVEGIFDQIGIDLVLWLPITEDCYNGICVIVEYLSKYVYAKPIKTKTAAEIAEVLAEYICLFGPPKILLSDQGTEFVNEVITKLRTRVGFEHKVTSAYNPRTNGLTERSKQDIIGSLRKHAESDTAKWDKHLPFVLAAIR